MRGNLAILATSTVLAVAGLSMHLLACEWRTYPWGGTSDDRLLLQLNGRVVLNKSAAEEYETLARECQAITGKWEEQVRTHTTDWSDAGRAKFGADAAKVQVNTAIQDRLLQLAWGKFGIYARTSRDTGLIAGMVIPVLLLLAATFLPAVAWISRRDPRAARAANTSRR